MKSLIIFSDLQNGVVISYTSFLSLRILALLNSFPISPPFSVQLILLPHPFRTHPNLSYVSPCISCPRMTGELHDNQFPSEEPFYDIRTLEAGYVMQAALVWMSAYYVIVKPLKLFGGDNQRTEEPNRPAPRLPKLFITWREYENVQ